MWLFARETGKLQSVALKKGREKKTFVCMYNVITRISLFLLTLGQMATHSYNRVLKTDKIE